MECLAAVSCEAQVLMVVFIFPFLIFFNQFRLCTDKNVSDGSLQKSILVRSSLLQGLIQLLFAGY